MSNKLKELYINYLSGYRIAITKTDNLLDPKNSNDLDEIIEEQTSFLQGHLDAEMDRILATNGDKEKIQFKSFLKFKSWHSENYPKTAKKNTGKKKFKASEISKEVDTTLEDLEEAV